jgi:hypothetical protein
MKLWILLAAFLLSACGGNGKAVKGPPVFGTREALETELAAVNSEMEQMNSLNAGAQARIKEYRKSKARDKESRIIEAEAEMHNNSLRKIALLKRKRELEAQIARQR